MAFTDRFIKIPIELVDNKLKDIIEDASIGESFMMINPNEICFYHPSTVDDKDVTYLVMNNGEKTVVYLTVPDFEELLNSFDK